VRRREFIGQLAGAVFEWLLLGASAQAQGLRKVKRIGFLRVGPPPVAWIEALRQGLREHGHIEGQNIVIDFGLTPNAAHLSYAASKLARLKVDIIFASGTPPLLAAKEIAGTIPVVFVAAIDPVATGLAASLAHPGGNITGLTNTQADITGKQLQLLKELLPGLSRIAVMVRAANQASARYVEEAETAARSLGVQLQVLAMRDPHEIEAMFMTARGASAVLLTDDAVFTANRTLITELARENRLPFISSTSEFAKSGGLMSYGPNTSDLYRRAAAHIDKILKGATAGELPIEQPTKFEFVINGKTAKVLGLTIPPTLLARADEVIE
jgi:putative ABC transport system substrate-binding protein